MKETNKQILDRVKKEVWKLNSTNGVVYRNIDLDIAEAYHQAKLKQLAPSDEAIHKKYNVNDVGSFIMNDIRAANVGAKWMRDQFINPKE